MLGEHKISTSLYRNREEIFSEELSPTYEGEDLSCGEMKYPLSESYRLNPYGAWSNPVPQFLFENLQKLAKNCTNADLQFPEFSGRKDLKESFLQNFPDIKKYFKNSNLTINNILVSNGDLRGISACIQALCEPYDELIVFEPIYPLHLCRTILRKDIQIRPIGMYFDKTSNRFEFDFNSLRSILNPKCKLMILSNPNNPTGRVFTKEEFQKISECIKEFPNLFILEDRAYFHCYSDEVDPMPFSIACPENFYRTITTYSMGKSLNANGIRVGFMMGDKNMIHKIGKIFPADVHLTPQLDQMLTRENLSSAIKSYNKFSSYYEFSRCDINDRIKRVEKEMMNCGINCLRWEGSYYFVLNVEAFRGKLPHKYLVDDDNRPIEELDRAFCRAAYKEFKIGLIPFSNHYFGNIAYDNFVRITVNHNDDDLKFLCDSMKSFGESCKIKSST